MLAVGVLGFFVLSGDYGDDGDPKPPDGWSAEVNSDTPPIVEIPQSIDAESGAITVHREPVTAPQADGGSSNPAAGAISQGPSLPLGPAGPNWMSGAAANDAPAGVQLTPPQNPAATSAAENGYPTTSSAPALPSSPVGAAVPSTYPSTGYEFSPVPYVPAPAARVGMQDAAPASGYPATGASQGPYPNTASPPAMSPRYERIR
jgi:hypothetical protein